MCASTAAFAEPCRVLGATSQNTTATPPLQSSQRLHTVGSMPESVIVVFLMLLQGTRVGCVSNGSLRHTVSVVLESIVSQLGFTAPLHLSRLTIVSLAETVVEYAKSG